MNTIKTPYWLVISCVLGLSLLVSFKPQPKDSSVLIEKEYMTILATSDEKGQNLKLHISVNGEKYIKENLEGIENQPKGNFDFNPLVKILNEYRRGGWVLISNNLSIKNQALSDVTIYNYFLLERDLPEFKKD
ncbi:MAG: hypothetical protein NW226_25530 [Microscillaceae bacterium]|nr:hypothetical protein [Microscillaceae bacterium]